jgi:hypothetical protein
MAEVISWEAQDDHYIQPFREAVADFEALLSDPANLRGFMPTSSEESSEGVVTDAVFLLNPTRGLLVTVRERMEMRGTMLEYEVAKTDGTPFKLVSNERKPVDSLRFVYTSTGLYEKAGEDTVLSSLESKLILKNALQEASPLQVKKK